MIIRLISNFHSISLAEDTQKIRYFCMQARVEHIFTPFLYKLNTMTISTLHVMFLAVLSSQLMSQTAQSFFQFAAVNRMILVKTI